MLWHDMMLHDMMWHDMWSDLRDSKLVIIACRRLSADCCSFPSRGRLPARAASVDTLGSGRLGLLGLLGFGRSLWADSVAESATGCPRRRAGAGDRGEAAGDLARRRPAAGELPDNVGRGGKGSAAAGIVWGRVASGSGSSAGPSPIWPSSLTAEQPLMSLCWNPCSIGGALATPDFEVSGQQQQTEANSALAGPSWLEP